MNPKQQFNVYLPPDLVARAKHQAIDDQLSLSDLTTRALEAYIGERMKSQLETLKLQPIIHVKDMEASIRFYEALGGTLLAGSRDGDWAQLSLGGAEIGLLAHPANPEQGEGDVELCFEYSSPLSELEQRLSAEGVTIARGAADEAFGEQLQLEAPGGMMVKINRLDPSTFQ